MGGKRSFIRLKHRSRVDLPQPEGPMMAVISRSGMLRLTDFSTWFVPYQSERSSAATAIFESCLGGVGGGDAPRSMPGRVGRLERPRSGSANFVRTPML